MQHRTIDDYNRVFGSETIEHQNDDPEYGQAFRECVRRMEVKKKIRDLDQITPQTITEYIVKEEKLKALEKDAQPINTLTNDEIDDSSIGAPDAEHPELVKLVSLQPTNQTDGKVQPAIPCPSGGAPKAPITEVIEWAYSEL